MGGGSRAGRIEVAFCVENTIGREYAALASPEFNLGGWSADWGGCRRGPLFQYGRRQTIARKDQQVLGLRICQMMGLGHEEVALRLLAFDFDIAFGVELGSSLGRGLGSALGRRGKIDFAHRQLIGVDQGSARRNAADGFEIKLRVPGRHRANDRANLVVKHKLLVVWEDVAGDALLELDADEVDLFLV